MSVDRAAELRFVESAVEPALAPAERRPDGRLRAFAHACLHRAHLRVVEAAEHAMHYAVAVVLMVVAAIVLVHTIVDLVANTGPIAQSATTAVNGVLFAIIIMEVCRTVMAHFDHGGLQLQPFLIIGTISAVREILSVGAHLSLDNAGGSATIHLALLELGVNAAVVLGLAAALVLVRRLAGMRDDD